MLLCSSFTITPPSARVAFVCVCFHLSRSLPHASFSTYVCQVNKHTHLSVQAVSAFFKCRKHMPTVVLCAHSRENRSPGAEREGKVSNSVYKNQYWFIESNDLNCYLDTVILLCINGHFRTINFYCNTKLKQNVFLCFFFNNLMQMISRMILSRTKKCGSNNSY